MSSPAIRSRLGWTLARRCLGGVVFVAVLLLALEITARVVVFGVGGLDPRRMPWGPGVSVYELVTFDTEPAIAYEQKPNLDQFLGMVRLRTNSRGMRDREYTLEKPAGTFRVAVIGSSFSVPAGVEIEAAYHSLLEERLSEKFAPRRYEFLNFAVGTHMPSQFVAMLLSRALPFDPDLVIISSTQMAVPHFLVEWDRTPTPGVLDQIPSGPRFVFVELLRSRLQLQPEKLGQKPPRFPPRLAGRRDVLVKLGAISRQRGIPIVVFRIAYDPRPPTRVENTLGKRARAEGLYYVDSRSAFEGTDPRSLWIHELDPHPNAVAHAIFADALGQFLESEGLLGR